MKWSVLYFWLLFAAPGLISVSHAQMTDTERNNWLLGVIFKLETMKEKAATEILKYKNEIAKCDNRIISSEKVLTLARQTGNAQAQAVAGEAIRKAQAARVLNEKNAMSAAHNKKRAEKALSHIKSGEGYVEAALEQVEFENEHSEWKRKQNQLIDQRLIEPNKNAGAIYRSLKSNVPPLPGKNFKDLQPGDVVLLAGNSAASKLLAASDNDLSSGGNVSIASHTVIYLKEVNGKKLFLDNQPSQGPRIITEDEFLNVYGNRGAEVARLAEPLNEAEGKRLFSEAVRMAQENRKEVAKNWFGSPLLGTNYGAWGKDDVVCSEADWVLINNAGRKVPPSTDQSKVDSGVYFSPADYVNSPYFIVTPLGIPK
jgi:hypothetical protein